MTSYTKYRGYPFPSSEREVGNGGLHSELLARAVARDLDTVDASWAGELQKPTSILTKTGDASGFWTPNFDQFAPFDTLEHASTGVGIRGSTGSGSFSVPASAQGWYHFSLSIHSVASGTVTANSRHRISIQRLGSAFGSFQLKEARYCETYQPASGEIYNTVEGVMYVEANDSVEAHYFHTNASNMTMRATGSRFAATLIKAG